jgi:hypothetical protein
MVVSAYLVETAQRIVKWELMCGGMLNVAKTLYDHRALDAGSVRPFARVASSTSK